MDGKDLLGAVQPERGRFAIMGMRGQNVRQVFASTRAEADEQIAYFNQNEWNVYFGVAKFGEEDNRTKENVVGLKCFWLDIDCGESKAAPNANGRPQGYATQQEGLAALKGFCATVGLPRPTLVDSGNGLHVYWPIDKELTRKEWEHVATRLREVCRAQDLYVDDKVFEVARVLRVPNTFNYKSDEPQPVKLVHLSEPMAFEDFCDLLGVQAITAPTISWDESENDKALNSNVTHKFSKIMRRSLQGEGCNQLAYAYNNRADLDYYEWFYALSVAARCEDANEAAHKLSSGHDGYDSELVDRKLATIRKSTSCARFQDNKPELCEGCPHLGKITGPLALGKIVKVYGGGVKFVEEDNAEQSGVKFLEADIDEGDAAEQPETLEPNHKLPRPYYVGEGGGIWRVPPEGAEEAEPVNVYQHNLFVEDIMNDNGDNVVVFKLHLPFGNTKGFAIPMDMVTKPDGLRAGLSAKGVAKHGKAFNLLMEYVMACVTEIQYKKKEKLMHQQFGWAGNYSKFIIGDQEITIDGVGYAAPSKITERLSQFMGPVGNLDKWKEVWKLYGQEGMEPFAFAALSAFGSPLLPFLNQTGAVINLFSPGSGTGKTTVLNMINSVYGHPKELRLQKDDTLNGRLMWVGILNNLPPTMDELTNVTGDELSNLLYALSNGKGKERMEASTNSLRINNTTWRSITVATANASFAEKLSIKKGSPQGEMMRLIEYPANKVDLVNTALAKQMFDIELYENYGHAGVIYMKYVLAHLEEVQDLVKKIQSKIDRELRLEPQERFWSATAASNIAGGMIAARIGLIDWNIPRIYNKFVGPMIQDLRRESTPPVVGERHIIGEYVNQNMDSILVINGDETAHGNTMPIPKKRPTRQLLIRIEPDTERMYVLAKSFKEFCVQFQYNYNETVKSLTKEGKIVDRKPVRLGKGTEVYSDPVYCLIFSISDKYVPLPEGVLPEQETADAS